MSLLIDIFGFLTVVLHGATLALQSFTIGGVAFLLIIAQPLFAHSQLDSAPVLARTRSLTRWSAIGLMLTSAMVLALKSAILIESMQIDVLHALTANFALADGTMVLAAAAIAVLTKRDTKLLWLPALTILIAATSVSHAAGRTDDRLPLALASGLHQAGAAVWIGGIPCFLAALALAKEHTALTFITRRYSLMSMASVFVIAAAGLAMAWVYIGSWDAVYGTAYGVMTSTKLMIFLALLALGFGNYRLVERLRNDPSTSVIRLRRFAEVELGVGITVFLAAASLTSLPPATDLTNDRATWDQIVERVLTFKTPSLKSPDHADLAIPALQTQLDREAESARLNQEPQAFIPGAGVPPPRNAQDIAWSEYNHHWAGLFVALIGLLALIERAGLASWAKHWPLVFIGLAVFLLIRSDPETWPLGDIGFFESFRDPEVVQHRLLVVLVGLFGIFEWRVRVGGLARSRAVYIFPLICATGGALLLAHSHALANIREMLLIEMTHTPLALFGMTSGWTRWLELRTDGRTRAVCSWLWPVCFLMVGLVLLSYRES